MKETFTETLHLAFDGELLTCEWIGEVEIDVHPIKADHEASKKITEGESHQLA